MISSKKIKGISLITLVITIVVVIILAAAVLLSLSQNNPINNARIANLVEGKDDIESGVLAYTSKIKAKTLAEFETEDIILGNNSKIENNRIIEKESDTYKSCKTTINGEEVTLYKLDEEKFKEQVGDLQRKPSSNSDWYLDKNGKAYLLFESIDKVPNWMKNKDDDIDNATLNSFVLVTGSAPKVAENPAEYYGKVVENYNAQNIEWKIFHSDGENIYLITSEYIPYEKIPTVEDTALNNGYYARSAHFTDILSYYSGGSEAIRKNPKSLEIAQKWLKSYFVDNNFSSNYKNMQAVAYMLDTEKWSSFADGTYADYAIGGPTVEMLFASYKKKYPETNVDYKAEVKTITGYQLSKDGGKSWIENVEDGIYLDKTDILYVLPEQSLSGANAIWLASPFYPNSGTVMYVHYGR